jgi:hypothetical protein
MANPQIKHYPVGNGDNSLITLKDNTTIMVDCNIREVAKGTSDPTKFDVKADLLKVLKKRGKDTFVDVFILTHGDEDHCLGFTKNFYQGDPAKYADKNREAEEIIMDEIWFTPMALETPTNDDEKKFKAEVNRRIKLHNDKDANKDIAGNRIVIIGYDGEEKLEDLDHLRVLPGSIVTKFNNKEQNTFSVFIHAPFAVQLKSSEKDKNYTSIVFQARFKNLATDTKYSCLAMFGGDADHYAWELILAKTKKKENDTKQNALDWDLFLAPHHCSWTYFNDTPPKDNPEPKKHSLEMLDYKRTGARVIASSKEILDNEDNPPYYKGKQQYVKKVGADNFLNTDTFKFIGKTPQPIIFEITAQGPMFPKEDEGSAKGAGGAGLGAINTVSTYGSGLV